MELIKLLANMSAADASDLFLTPNKPPCFKVRGQLKELPESVLSADAVRKLVLATMSKEQQQSFLADKELNYAIQDQRHGRFRVSAYFERFHISAVFRRISSSIPTLAQLGLPAIFTQLCMLKRGLVIVAGATGVGKSTTLASMLEHRNQNSANHIVTIEDPIEYLHEHKASIVSQREVGTDTQSYKIALQNTLRQAPDVIMIGEIRNSDTMEYALRFAETGHLCLTTLHANNANQAIERILSFFPETKSKQILLDLSLNLKAVIAQQLIINRQKDDRLPAIELMLNSPIVQQCIRNGEIAELKSFMAKGETQGMQTFDQSLFELYKQNRIDYEEALRHADSENDLRLKIKMHQGKTDDQVSNLKLKPEDKGK